MPSKKVRSTSSKRAKPTKSPWRDPKSGVTFPWCEQCESYHSPKTPHIRSCAQNAVIKRNRQKAQKAEAQITTNRIADEAIIENLSRRLLRLLDQESPTPAKAVKPPHGKRIVDHTAEELEAAIGAAVTHCTEHGLLFFKILHGIDAYMERRRRQGPGGLIGLGGVSDYADVWGNS